MYIFFHGFFYLCICFFISVLQDIQTQEFVYLDQRDIAQDIEPDGNIKEDVHSIFLKNLHGDQQVLQANSDEHDDAQSYPAFDGTLSSTRKRRGKNLDSPGLKLCTDVCKDYSKNER